MLVDNFLIVGCASLLTLIFMSATHTDPPSCLYYMMAGTCLWNTLVYDPHLCVPNGFPWLLINYDVHIGNISNLKGAHLCFIR